MRVRTSLVNTARGPAKSIGERSPKCDADQIANKWICARVPDLSMIGYVANAQVGATAYNAVHTYSCPLILAAYGLGSGHNIVLAVALIWIPHIGLDRLLGYGLKYPTYFKDTHLSPRRHALPD